MAKTAPLLIVTLLLLITPLANAAAFYTGVYGNLNNNDKEIMQLDTTQNQFNSGALADTTDTGNITLTQNARYFTIAGCNGGDLRFWSGSTELFNVSPTNPPIVTDQGAGWTPNLLYTLVSTNNNQVTVSFATPSNSGSPQIWSQCVGGTGREVNTNTANCGQFTLPNQNSQSMQTVGNWCSASNFAGGVYLFGAPISEVSALTAANCFTDACISALTCSPIGATVHSYTFTPNPIDGQQAYYFWFEEFLNATNIAPGQDFTVTSNQFGSALNLGSFYSKGIFTIMAYRIGYINPYFNQTGPAISITVDASTLAAGNALKYCEFIYQNPVHGPVGSRPAGQPAFTHGNFGDYAGGWADDGGLIAGERLWSTNDYQITLNILTLACLNFGCGGSPQFGSALPSNLTVTTSIPGATTNSAPRVVVNLTDSTGQIQISGQDLSGKIITVNFTGSNIVTQSWNVQIQSSGNLFVALGAFVGSAPGVTSGTTGTPTLMPTSACLTIPQSVNFTINSPFQQSLYFSVFRQQNDGSFTQRTALAQLSSLTSSLTFTVQYPQLGYTQTADIGNYIFVISNATGFVLGTSPFGIIASGTCSLVTIDSNALGQISAQISGQATQIQATQQASQGGKTTQDIISSGTQWAFRTDFIIPNMWLLLLVSMLIAVIIGGVRRQ